MSVLKITAAAGALLLAATNAFAADDVASFYKGRTVTMDIGYSSGGGYDLYARVLARHLGDHIPGKPNVVPQNMPGAGSLKVVNYLANIAPKDGTVIATFARGMAMEPLFDKTGIEFDAQKLNWIGSITNEVSVCAFRSDSGVNDLAGHADEVLHGRRHRLGLRHRRLSRRAAPHVPYENQACDRLSRRQ